MERLAAHLASAQKASTAGDRIGTAALKHTLSIEQQKRREAENDVNKLRSMLAGDIPLGTLPLE